MVGIIVPLVGLGLVVWQPNLLESLGVDKNVVSLIFIAWLLLAIDASLKLGIVAGITELAKGIKTLG